MKSGEKQDTLNETDAEEIKTQGNKYFAARKYGDAVTAYSKAISKRSDVPTYYTNRALCYIKLQQWDKATEDCKKAIELDHKTLKAHFFMGQALLEMGQFDESIHHLVIAQDLSKENKTSYGDEITWFIRTAKKKRFGKQEEKRIRHEIELQSYLNELMAEDLQKQLSYLDIGHGDDVRRRNLQDKHDQRVQELNHLFTEVDQRRQKRDVPDYLCGQISFDLMRDPVITPSGITYERKNIEEHIQRVGHFDPVTRKDLTKDMLIPNLAMKEVINCFLEQNPWAEDY